MKKMTIIGLLLAIGIAISAQNMTLSQLNRKVLELENRIRRLEKLLFSKVGSPSSYRKSRVQAGKAAWRRLRNGMSPALVRRLLGEPAKVFVIADRTIWQYTGGTVAFINGYLIMWFEE